MKKPRKPREQRRHPQHPPYRMNQAGNILGVLWAIVDMSENGVTLHSKKAIADKLHGAVTAPTITKALDLLENEKVIECNYPRGSRQGKRLEYSQFKPDNIPAYIRNKKLPPSTAHRWKEVFVNAVGVSRYDDGRVVLDAENLSKLCGDDLLSLLSGQLEELDPSDKDYSLEDTESWLIRELDGSIVEFEPDTMGIFHRFICWKVEKFYADA